MLRDFISLLFPVTCEACGISLFRHEYLLCKRCSEGLPKTHFHAKENNPVEQMLHGRIDIVAASSFYYFTKSGRVQRLLHHLKYKNKPEIGALTGRWLGEALKTSGRFNHLDHIIPVPLHPAKERQRGYNQSQSIAEGISEALNIEVTENGLHRTALNQSQTRLHRYERWESVKDAFTVNEEIIGYEKNILLVDDVITTGATLEACSQVLREKTRAKIYIATLAWANHN